MTVAVGVSQLMMVGPGGIQRRHPVEKFPDEDWEEVLQVNLSTVFAITRDAGTSAPSLPSFLSLHSS